MNFFENVVNIEQISSRQCPTMRFKETCNTERSLATEPTKSRLSEGDDTSTQNKNVRRDKSID
jgi:hypothetical protein